MLKNIFNKFRANTSNTLNHVKDNVSLVSVKYFSERTKFKFVNNRKIRKRNNTIIINL